MTPETRPRYLTLDGLRGVAALVICFIHTTDWWGGLSLPSGHLAVDLFFVLSGFIVAEVYGRRLSQGLGGWGFLRLRLIRFYPMFLAGLLLGASRDFLSWHYGLNEAGYTSATFFGSLGLNLLFLPSPLLGPREFFPMLGVAWSLFYELAVNGVAAAFWQRLQGGLLKAVAALGGAALLAEALLRPGLHGGSGWRFSDWRLALVRVTWCFAIGMLIQRADRGRWPRLPWFIPLALGAALLLWDPGQAEGPYAAGAVLLGFPLAVGLGVVAIEPKGLAAKLCAFLGLVSYPLYAIHMPLGSLGQGLLKRVWMPVNDLAPWSGFVLLALLLALSWGLYRWVDEPVRRSLRA